MRNILFPAILVASIAASGAAFATDQVAKGTITTMDAKACTVTLDKAVYQFAPKCDFSKLKVGENVTITFNLLNKVNTATKIAAA